MKKLVILFSLLGYTFYGYCQSTEREVIATGGNFFSNGTGQLSITIGEPVIESFSAGINELTQGFQQTKMIITILEDFEKYFEIGLYPNPVSEYVTINFSELKMNLTISLTAIDGKELINKKISEKKTELDMSTFPKSIYLLNIYDSKKVIKTYKIVKQ